MVSTHSDEELSWMGAGLNAITECRTLVNPLFIDCAAVYFQVLVADPSTTLGYLVTVLGGYPKTVLPEEFRGRDEAASDPGAFLRAIPLPINQELDSLASRMQGMA